ncbi:MAG: CheY chemotaxis protein/Signal transduction histidine kinase, nitrogen specific [Verrucomicrobia bacterium]|nr:MAG: CheY chemotaxis protein/Signal transduction histidine kinase, nitrogen specific [Verrucomicrobiota bacterium]
MLRSRVALLAVLESAPEAVVLIDARDQIVFCNGEAERLWGADPETLVGHRVQTLFGQRFGFIDLDAPEGQSFVTEAEALRSDGVAFTVRLTLRRAAIDGETHRALWMSPAWERRRESETRAEILSQQALERFAAGVAHEWNNLLTIVLGNLHLALQDGAGPGRNRSTVLEWAYQAALRCREVARGLMEFASGEAPAIVPCSVQTLTWENSLLGLGGTKVKLDADFGPELTRAALDAGHTGTAIQRVVAFLAGLMAPGKRIRLTGRNFEVRLPQETCGGRLLPGDYVVVSVVADGLRLREDDLRQLFSPYLEVSGSNSGMRLAEARALIARQDGWLEADRTEKGGTAFHFYLPAAEGTGPDLIPLQEPGESDLGLSVLVMDDEPLVRTLLQRILEGMGHRVTLAADGEEAAEVYATAMRRGERFDLAILDLKPGPGSGGVEACERIREVDPLAACVLSSGSVLDEAMTDFHGYGFAGVLEKPFEASALSKLVQDVAGGRPGNRETAGDSHEELVQLSHDNILEVDFTSPERRWE